MYTVQNRFPVILVFTALLSATLLSTATARNSIRCYQTEIAISTGQPGHHLGVAMASDRTIHVIHQDAGTQLLTRTSRVAGVWQTATFSSAVAITDLAMALGPGELPLAIYIEAATGQIVWLDPAVGQASAEIVNPAGPAATHFDFVADSTGRMMVLYYSAADQGLWFAERIVVTGAWTAPLRISPALGPGGLALDSHGDPWLALTLSDDLLLYHRTGSNWTHDVIVEDFPFGLKPNPAILIDSTGQPTVTWLGGGNWHSVYRSYFDTSWEIEAGLGVSTAVTPPRLSIHEEPWRGDVNVGYLQGETGDYFLHDRFGDGPYEPGIWDLRVFAGPIAEAAVAPHVDSGMVLAFRRGNTIEVQHQEVVPTVSGHFEPNPAVGGETTQLVFTMGCADRLEFDGDIILEGTVTSGSQPYFASEAGNHVLTALNGYATATDEIYLEVEPFGALDFTASRALSAQGDPVTLTWTAIGADLIQIEPGGFAGTDSSGSVVVYPTATTIYDLTAENTGYGTTHLSTTVAVELFTGFNFGAAPTGIIAGEASTLTWAVAGADSIHIEPGGFAAADSTGEIVVTPTTTTTYTLTAINAGFGQQTEQVTVVVDPLRIASFTGSPELVILGEAVTLEWLVQGTGNVEVEGFGSQPLAGSLQVFPTGDTQYTLRAVNGGFLREEAVDIATLPHHLLEFSFSATEIDRSPPAITPVVPFDVYIHWSGPSRSMQGLEFGVDLPPNGFFIVGSECLLRTAVNFGTATDWQIYGSCFSPGTATAVARLSLIVAVADDLAGASLALRGIPGGDFPAGPGYIACEPANVDVVGGAPLVLDPAVVGVPLPHASATRIAQIHPNPFNPQVSIRLELQGSGPVRLEVYDLAGRLVKVLAVHQGAAGSQVVQWDGRDAQGREAASGVYMICLQEGGVVDVRRVALLR